MPDVLAATLDHVAGKVFTALGCVEVEGGECRIQEADEVAEPLVLARVWRCRHEQQVPLLVARQVSQEVVALVTALARDIGVHDRSVGFVDDDQLRRCPDELVAATLRLDEVG